MIAEPATDVPPVTEESTPVVGVPVTVPGPYRINVRVATSVESERIAGLEVGTTVMAIARTVDNSWLRIVLPDGREGWVYRETIGASVEVISGLPEIYTTP
jgi:SH3-like domain-containing protein